MTKLDKDIIKMLGDETKQTKLVEEIEISNKSRLVSFLLCYIFGMLGAHRFYVGKNGTAILYILTMGLFGIGMMIDLLMIILGKFKTADGHVVRRWIEE